jgi:CubicO group peptidase (beta-lactamase class C family)
MFTTVGEVIGAVSGKRWDAYLKEVIWEPLGMHETGASLDEALASPNHASAHALIGKELRPLPHWEPERNIFEITGPSGAVISTAHDMAQWLRLQLGDGRYGERELIDSAIFHEMHTAHTPMRDVKGATSWFQHIPAADLKISDQSYAMGWRVSRYRDRPMIWHGGTVSGFRTVVAFMPQEKVAVFVNGNRESLFPFAVALTVFDAYLGVHDTDWNRLFLTERALQEQEEAADQQKVESARIKGSSPSLPIARYTGRYYDGAAFGEAVVSRAGSRLTLRLGAKRGSLEHWHHDVFRVHWDQLVPEEAFVSFEIDQSGAPALLRIDNIGRFESIALVR